jgi:hypothetical protein
MPDARLEIALNYPAATGCEYAETKTKSIPPHFRPEITLKTQK